MYRPPHCGFLQEFFNIFMDLHITHRHSMILGDFNADLFESTFDSKHILDFIEHSNLYLVPYNATHHTKSSATFLDLCIIDDRSKLISHKQHDVSFLSAHDLIGLTYDVKIRRNVHKTVTIKDLRDFKEDNLIDDLLFPGMLCYFLGCYLPC